MLVEVKSRKTFERLLKLSQSHMDTVYFRLSIEGHLANSFPESPIRVFCFPNDAKPRYMFMIKDNVFIKPSCYIAHVPDTPFDRIEFLECLMEFRRRALGDDRRPHLLVGKEDLVKVYTCLMRSINSDLNNEDLNLFLFFMEMKQRQAIMKHKATLPEGYYFEEIDPMTEGEMINSTWKHAKEGDLEQTIAKLVRLPSACVKNRGEPVAFEMLDPAGYFNNQFVFEQHRRKGLGTAVEYRLAQRCVCRGWQPFKTVDQRNTAALSFSAQSPYWTQWTKEDGKPVSIVFQEWKLE